MDLAQRVLARDRRAVAKAITLVERDEGQELLRAIHDAGAPHVIGITGAPGTGKSTLVDRLIERFRKRGLRVGVLAVDPSSPFTGGAILGDRIRMQGHSGDPDVFIRSLGTRGALGGLTSHTFDAIKVLSAAGFDVVLVETVGVGQAEVDIVRVADTVIVVLVPNLGDDVQAVKAGIMEIADVFCINKSDLGADRVQAEVAANMMLVHPEAGAWVAPIVQTVAERGEGTDALVGQVDAHAVWSKESGAWEERRSMRRVQEICKHLEQAAVRSAFGPDGTPRPSAEAIVDLVRNGTLTPHDAAQRLLGAHERA